jgi:2-oxoisovalerate dehydrogenase E1 component beta subunit
MAEISYVEAISQALDEEMERDQRVLILGEDVGAYGGAFGITEGLMEKYGFYRCLDTPISESLIVGGAIGAAMMGFRPVAEMQFADFISCAFDQISNQAGTLRYRYGGRMSCPIVVRAPSSGGVRGGPYHSQNPEGWFAHTPGLKIVCPAFADDAKGLLKTAIRDDDPVIYFESKFLYRRIKGEVPEGDHTVPLGEARLVREGSDVSIIAYGTAVHQAIEAAETLAEDDIEAEILDLRTLVPLDTEAVLATAAKTSHVVIAHEDWKRAGYGAEVAALIAEEAVDHLDGPIVRVASQDTPIPFATTLETAHLPSAEKIVAGVRRALRLDEEPQEAEAPSG